MWTWYDKTVSQDHERRLESELQQWRRTAELLQTRIRGLEEENGRLAGLLLERGVNVHAASTTVLELPPPPAQPLAADDDSFHSMRPDELGLLREALGGTDGVFALVLSDTRADTGGWFRRPKVWVAATRDRLAVWAAGRRPWLETIEFSRLRESLYNHVTGELVLAPALEMKRRCLRMSPLDGYRMSPLDGYRMLALIYQPQGD
ncbi:MAG: hypothetical protein HY343_10205 [Lentisphaerae bacterium]|nr:hypothetical protein [Lentisphaerota bacterium]